jgi:branched-chain amino acid transport system substrate-binding protein
VNTTRIRRWRKGAALSSTIFVAVGTGCGTRVHQPSATPGLAAANPAPGVTTATAAQVDPSGSAAAPSEGSVNTGGAGTATPSSRNEKNQHGPPSVAPGRSSTPAGAAAGNTGSAGNTAKKPTDPGARGGVAPAPTAPGSPAVATGGPKSPLVVASVGTYSGPVGVALIAILQGAQVWIKHINAKGGVNGHPVELIVYDDGGDPARHRAQVQEAVERRKALAFLANGEPFTASGEVDYINEKRVPVIGTELGLELYYQSPMYFIQGSAGNTITFNMLPMTAQYEIPKGNKKLGTIVCAEVSTCTDGGRLISREAPRHGFDPVYNGQASITQPDYTAECLAAKSAGVQVLFLIMTSNAIERIAASCARQAYRPVYVITAANILDSMAKNPNLENTYGASNVFPFFQSGTPATDEYQEAMRNYGKGITKGVGAPTGWGAGKLLERAGANLPEPPTTEAILRGLWSIRDDTLGGLTPVPLTFVENRPPSRVACWYTLQIKGGVWTSPDKNAAHCATYPAGAG